MLTIKRVPTVLSNYQEEAAAHGVLGCGRNCLGRCCLPVSKLPLYAFNEERKDFPVGQNKTEESPIDFLNTLVFGQWEDRMSRGLFRYDVTACETKIIPGKHGFIAQINEGRHLKKRPTEFRIDCVLQAFDPNKFNFTKVGQEDSHSGLYLNKAPSGGAGAFDGGIVASNEDNVFTQRTKPPRRKPAKDFKEELGDEATDGIWAPFKEKSVVTAAEAGTLSAEQEKLRQERIEAKKRKAEERATSEFDEDMDFDRMVEKKNGHLLPARLKAGQKAMEARTEFVGGEEYDYLGRSWVEPPRGLKPESDGADHAVFLPKKCIHKWAGHTKGVQAIELFPRYGHLVLSGSLDHTVRIWDVYNERQCKRVYEGHTGAVRGINMSNDGRQFLSCGFDRFLRLWDTETGQSIKSFTNRRVPYCIKFHPEDNTNFVIGDSNNMVVQFDTRSGEIVQEYNHHLQAVNSVTFVDDNRRFVSTSDDKKILIWEWGIPVPIKYISEPSMHSMPAVTLHPSGGFFAGQSLNNQIDVYTARDKFKIQRKKVFKGHSNAGYACQLNFSPNGQYLVSGDGEGKLCFWDWKSTKMYKKLRAHDRGPCMGVAWHPVEPSQVVSCGWDGLIKLWD